MLSLWARLHRVPTKGVPPAFRRRVAARDQSTTASASSPVTTDGRGFCAPNVPLGGSGRARIKLGWSQKCDEIEVIVFPPERIVCLTEETVETLYLLGEEQRIVGVSGYAVRPPRVRKEKPRVSAFISADFDKILALDPDLVLTFSDLQADIVAALIRRGVTVHAFNQRDVAGILAMIRTLGALVDARERAEALAATLMQRLDAVRERVTRLPRRPRVYFEEWDDPMISGIRWVSELIEAAGGIEAFPGLTVQKSAKDRVVTA